MPIRTILRAAAFAALAALPACAQSYYQQEIPRWHVNGFAGFNITHTSQRVTNQLNATDQLYPLGDLRLNGDGFLLDPKFLHLNAGFDYQKGANTSDRGEMGTGGTNVAVSSIFLPKSHVPLRVAYTRTNHGVTGLGLDQNDDNSRLDVQWNMLFPNLPHLTASFQNYGSTVHVPSSFNDRTYNEKAFGVSLYDVWKQWHWAGNYSRSSGDSTGVSELSLNSVFDNSTHAGGFNLNRSFLDSKALLRFENREAWRRDHLGGDGTSRSEELTNNVNFDVQLTPKVSLSTGYAFAQVDFRGDGFANVGVPGAGQIQVISLVSSTSNSGSGRVDYRPWEWLRLSQGVRTTFSTPVDGLVESRTSFTDTESTVTAERRWRSFDLMGSYTGRYQLAGTTLDRSPNSWSNSFNGRVGWGDVRRVRLTASGQDTRLNLVEQIGGFTDQKRISLEAETHRVKYFRLRASGEYSQVDLLNVSGKTGSTIKVYSVAAEHRHFTVAYMNSFMDGVGALFPFGLIDRQFLVIPLPISQLLATPLLDRTTHSQSVTFIGRPRRRLEVSAVWRTEDTQLTLSDQTFDVVQADARYHLGKFTLEGGYSRNLYDVTTVTGLNGNRLSLWYFRIGRDFRVF